MEKQVEFLRGLLDTTEERNKKIILSILDVVQNGLPINCDCGYEGVPNFCPDCLNEV